MIQITGNIQVKFTLGEIEDFINVNDLQSFLIVEDAGGVLPTFKLIFSTIQEEVMKNLNEGSVIQLSIGKKDLNTEVIDLVCTSILINKLGDSRYMIHMFGIYDALDYIIKPQLYISSAPESALDALGTVVARYFTSDFDPTISSDSQIYIQPNISDKKFALQLLSQIKFSNSAPIFGITYDGFFKVRDIKELASKPYSWKFTKEIKDENKDILYESGDVLEGSSGMINSLYGYGRNIYLLDFESGLSEIETDSSTSVFSNSSAPSRKSSINERMGAIVPMNSNLDSDFYKTGLRNAMYNFTCSQYKKTVRFINDYRPIQVLDLVTFDEISVKDKKTMEYLSGLYVVTKVVRTISASCFQTTCEICRESLNSSEGDNR